MAAGASSAESSADSAASGSGAGGAGTARCDKRGHRHRRGKNVLDDLAHRQVEAAGRVDAQDDQLRIFLFRSRKGAAREVRGGGADGTAERNDQHWAGTRVGKTRRCRQHT